MSLLCCQPCRLRFTPVAAAYLTTCPRCGLPTSTAPGPDRLVGFQLLDPLDVEEPLPEALTVSLPDLNPDGAWS